MRKDDMGVVQIQKLRPNATIPTRGSEQAAGSDLYSVEEVEIAPGEKAMVSTGIALAIPTDVYARIAPRSGLAVKYGIDVLAGVVDSDYRGEIKIILVNLGKESFLIKPGDRIAQLILERIKIPLFSEVNNLAETSRDAKGFGSTGV